MRRWETTFVAIFLLLYTIAASLVSLHRFWQFNAFWWDLGIFDSTIWQLSRFQFPVTYNLAPPTVNPIWGNHFNPSVLSLVPIYWLTDKIEAILVLQVLFVVSSAAIFYVLAQKLMVVPLIRVALVFTYLGFVGMQNALYTDAHNIVFSLLPLSLAIFFIYTKKWIWYWLAFGYFLGWQENLAAVGIGLGMFLILSRKNTKIGLVTIIVSLLYGLFLFKIFMPWLNSKPYDYQPVIPVDIIDFLKKLFWPLELKTKTIVTTFVSFGILPLFYPPIWPLLIEHFVERFVFNVVGTRWDLGFHYNALLSPILALGIIETAKKFQTKHKIAVNLWSLATITIVLVLHQFILHGPLILSYHPVFYEQTVRAGFQRKLIEKIPRGGLVMAPNDLASHLTHERLILLDKHVELIKPDVIVLDTRPGQNPNAHFPLNLNEVLLLENKLTTNSSYRQVAITNEQKIFLKN